MSVSVSLTVLYVRIYCGPNRSYFHLLPPCPKLGAGDGVPIDADQADAFKKEAIRLKKA